jgi:hypothetical protein
VPWIVDGDNLLGGWPGRSRSEADKRRLSGEVARLAVRMGGRDVLLVFDGRQPEGVAFAGQVRFPGQGRSADDLILERLRGSPDPRGVTVVTDDRSLGDQARHLGARVERCAAFRERLAAPASEKPDAADDLDYWKDVFGEP